MPTPTGLGENRQSSRRSEANLWHRLVRSSNRGLHYLGGAYLGAALFSPVAFFLGRFIQRNPEAGFSAWGGDAVMCLVTGALTMRALLAIGRRIRCDREDQEEKRCCELLQSGLALMFALFMMASGVAVLIGGYEVLLLVLPMWLSLPLFNETRRRL